MKLVGDTARVLLLKSGTYTIRIEGFQDDRFRLMFVCRHNDKDIKWIPMKFTKGTKTLNLEKDAWPLIEDSFKKALSSVEPT